MNIVLLYGVINMNTIQGIRDIIKSEKVNFRKLGIVRVGIFGSYIRGEATESSDVDILIELNRDSELTLFSLIELEQRLSERFDAKADIVLKRDLKKFIGKQVESEVSYV